MAPKGIAKCLVLVLIVMLWEGAMAQSSCTNALMSMSPCLQYVTGNSSTPSSPCCSQLSSVVQTQPQCLCSLMNGAVASVGLAINQSLALTLPGACKVKTPPFSQCNAVAGGPMSSASSPVNAPTTSPPNSSKDTPKTTSTPSAPIIPAGSASKTVPTTGSTSDGCSVKSSIQLTIAVLLFAACASNVLRF